MTIKDKVRRIIANGRGWLQVMVTLLKLLKSIKRLEGDLNLMESLLLCSKVIICFFLCVAFFFNSAFELLLHIRNLFCTDLNIFTGRFTATKAAFTLFRVFTRTVGIRMMIGYHFNETNKKFHSRIII